MEKLNFFWHREVLDTMQLERLQIVCASNFVFYVDKLRPENRAIIKLSVDFKEQPTLKNANEKMIKY